MQPPSTSFKSRHQRDLKTFRHTINMTEIKTEGGHEAHWVTISSDEYESMKRTIEILSDPEAMEQLRKSEEDIKAGSTKKWSEFVQELRNEQKD